MSQPNPMHVLNFAPPQSVIRPDAKESIPLYEAAERIVKRGIDAARSGHRPEALELFDEALRIDADNVEALLWRGGLSSAEEALPFLERAVALAPADPRARDGLAWARQQTGLTAMDAAVSTPRPMMRSAVERQTPPQPVVRPITVPASRPSIVIPDVAGALIGALAYLVERPTLALVTALLLLGLLGTAAVARAGLSKGDDATLPPAQTLHLVLPTATAVKGSALPAASQPVSTTQSTAAVAPSTLDQAWAAQDWPQVITILEGMLKRSPNDADLTPKLFSAHFNYAVQLVRNEHLAEAVAEFDKALAIDPNNTDAQGERLYAKLYLDGTTALSSGDFAGAVSALRTIYDGNPDYRQVKSRLYQAYIGYADGLVKQGQNDLAYLAYSRASKMNPQGMEAQTGMSRLNGTAAAQAAAMGKKIEVSLSKQQVVVWENGKVLYTMKASTGKEPYVTRTGTFEILDKMPEAYSNALGWGMPYWMGVYQAGGTENGFHAMARLKDGSVLSTALLGKPATSGCIMIGDYDAKVLYNWAPIGTPVIIHE